MTLKTDIDQLAVDAGLLHDIIHGGTSDTVSTDGGTVPSVAKAINDAVNAIESGQVADGSAAAPSIAFANDTDSGIYRIGANNIGVAVNGAKVVDISTGGAAVTGMLDLSAASSGQIKFPATQNASSNANTLDDYEEGTWTPTDASGAGLSITGFDCKYTKVGRLVTLSGSLVYPVTASGANAKVAVPFTPGQQRAVGAAAGVSANVSSYTAPTDAGLYFITNTGGAVQTNATLSGSNVLVTITYSV